ncbi:hypothetical protein A2U01_0059781, partial [Trifolium medium]|nr:hypothetical protein [Trifolium medium]
AMVEIKMIEEWGFKIGEDACLFEEGDTQESNSEQAVDHGDQELSNHVDMLVEKLADDFARDEGELNENLDKPTGEERVADRDSQGDSYVAHSLLREDTV